MDFIILCFSHLNHLRFLSLIGVGDVKPKIGHTNNLHIGLYTCGSVEFYFCYPARAKFGSSNVPA